MQLEKINDFFFYFLLKGDEARGCRGERMEEVELEIGRRPNAERGLLHEVGCRGVV